MSRLYIRTINYACGHYRTRLVRSFWYLIVPLATRCPRCRKKRVLAHTKETVFAQWSEPGTKISRKVLALTGSAK